MGPCWCFSGYVYTFEVGGQKGKTGPPDGCDAPEKYGKNGFVLRLIEKPEKEKYKLFLDNFFSSPKGIGHWQH